MAKPKQNKQRWISGDELDEMRHGAWVYELNGPYPGRKTQANHLQFQTVDQPGESYDCLQVPSTGFNFSCMKTIFLYLNKEQFNATKRNFGFKKIVGIYLYTQGNLGQYLDYWHGSDILVGHRDDNENGLPLDKYVQCSTPIMPISDHPYYRDQTQSMASILLFNRQTPYLIDKTVYTKSFESKAVVTQCLVRPTATHGHMPLILFSWGLMVEN